MLQWQSSERCDFDLISKLNLRPALAAPAAAVAVFQIVRQNHRLKID